MRSQDLSSAMLIARVSCERAQAHIDALDGAAASRAWAAVREAQWDGLRLHAKAEALYEEETRHQPVGARHVPFEQVGLVAMERWLEKARSCTSAPPP